ncbi:MAG: DUF3857 domain-containing protein [Phycisphaerae bacterium]
MSRRRAVWGFVCILGVLGHLAPVLHADDIEDVKARIAAAGDAEKYDADAVIVLEATDVTVRPNGIGVARRHKVVKILRDGAIRSQAVQRFGYEPNTNKLELSAVRVYRADGSVEEIPIDGCVDQPQPSHLLYWGHKQLVVALPRLEVGDALETVSVLTGFNVAYLADEEEVAVNAFGQVLKPPVPGHWHDEVHFWSSLPVIEKRYTVRVPKDKPLQYEIYNGEVCTSATFDGDHVAYSFIKEDIEPFESEPSMESAPNVAPKLLLATLPDWQSKGRWLHSVSEPQLEADDAIRAKVAEIIKDCKTDEEKYTALNHWVAENVRYAGTTRGMSEGYTIHDIKETFRDRCGVCKDKAGMLCGMLRVAGFESYTVMTMARQRVDFIPADQFNHCVTCIRKEDGSLILLDPTWMPKSRDNWSTLEPLQHVVYGTPEGEPLSLSPYFPPEHNLASWRATSEIDRNSRLTGSFDFTSCGAPEGRLRRTLAGLHPSKLYRFFDNTIMRLSPNARMISVTHTDPVDFSRPMNIKADFAVDHFAIGDGDKRYLSLPMLQTVLGDRTLYDLFGKTSREERKYGIKLLATRLARFEETLRLPGGWTVVNKPEPVGIDGPAAGLHFDIETSPGQIRYTCELSVKRWVIPPDEYANFKEVMEKFEELAGRTIACKLEARSVRR